MAQGFARAEERVIGGGVADLFPADGILLVSERESRCRDAGDVVQVIQRCGHSGVELAIDGEANIAEAEGLGARFGVVADEEVFCWPEEPEEGEDSQVGD